MVQRTEIPSKVPPAGQLMTYSLTMKQHLDNELLRLRTYTGYDYMSQPSVDNSEDPCEDNFENLHEDHLEDPYEDPCEDHSEDPCEDLQYIVKCPVF